MAELVVVDSDLIIDYLRGRGPGAQYVRSLLSEGRLRITAITALELRVGTDALARHADIMRLARRRTFPIDLASALRAGEVAASLRAGGRDIGLADCLQAGVCLRHNLPFATRNRRHFERIEGLLLIDPAGGAA